MSEAPLCGRCGRRAMDIGAYRLGSAAVLLCPGCVADARSDGLEVRWVPPRMHRATGLVAFRAALETQARIIEDQRTREDAP